MVVRNLQLKESMKHDRIEFYSSIEEFQRSYSKLWLKTPHLESRLTNCKLIEFEIYPQDCKTITLENYNWTAI